MRQEYSLRKLFLGLAFKPENRANPSSSIRRMRWLLCSMDQSLSARQARKAWAAGIIREPGKRAVSAQVATAKRARSGRKRNRPPQQVKKWRGARENCRASATASRVGRGVWGRSSSRRRGNGAKPSARRTSLTAVELKESF